MSPYNAITNFSNDGSLNGLGTIPLIITFTVPQDSVYLTGGDRGGDTDQFTVTAFDQDDTHLGTVTTEEFGGNTYSTDGYMVDNYTVHLTFPGMKEVVVYNAINYGIGLDNIRFGVPQPSSLLFLASGLLGLAGLKRRFRS